MATIIDVTKENVYLKDGAVYYEVSKELFPFKPRVGYKVRLYKDENGKVYDVILISLYHYAEMKRPSKRILNLQSIYTLIVGIILLFVVVGDDNQYNSFNSLVYWISIIFIAAAIFSFLSRHLKRLYIVTILTTIIYILFIILGIAVVVIKNNQRGFILALVGVVPIVLNILYFRKIKKEKMPRYKHFPDI